MAAAVARGSMLDLAIVQSTGTNWLLYFPRSDCVPRARRLPTIYSSLEPHVHACYYLTVDLYALERLRLGLLPSQTGQTPTYTNLCSKTTCECPLRTTHNFCISNCCKNRTDSRNWPVIYFKLQSIFEYR